MYIYIYIHIYILYIYIYIYLYIYIYVYLVEARLFCLDVLRQVAGTLLTGFKMLHFLNEFYSYSLFYVICRALLFSLILTQVANIINRV